MQFEHGNEILQRSDWKLWRWHWSVRCLSMYALLGIWDSIFLDRLEGSHV